MIVEKKRAKNKDKNKYKPEVKKNWTEPTPQVDNDTLEITKIIKQEHNRDVANEKLWKNLVNEADNIVWYKEHGGVGSLIISKITNIVKGITIHDLLTCVADINFNMEWNKEQYAKGSKLLYNDP
jgi:hypothetical protein